MNELIEKYPEAIFGLIGVLLGYSLKFLTDLVSIREETKREKFKMFTNLGKEYWQEALSIAKHQAEFTKTRHAVYPLESFVLTTFHLFNKLGTKHVNKKNITKTLKENDEYRREVNKFYDEIGEEDSNKKSSKD